MKKERDGVAVPKGHRKERGPAAEDCEDESGHWVWPQRIIEKSMGTIFWNEKPNIRNPWTLGKPSKNC